MLSMDNIYNIVNDVKCIAARLYKRLYFGVAKTEFIAFRVAPELKRELQRIAADEQRAFSQICEMFLYEGIESAQKEGPKFMQRLVARQKNRVKNT
jgi:hypothetical protein